MDHADRGEDAAALDELDVDPVEPSLEPRHILGHHGALVSNQGKRRLGVDLLHGLKLVRGKRLLDELNAELGKLSRLLHGLRNRPGAVCIDPEERARLLSERADDLDVAFRSELDLDDRVVVRLTELGDHSLHRVDSNGEGRKGQPGRVQAQQAVEGEAELATYPIEEGKIEGRKRRTVVSEPLPGLLENLPVVKGVLRREPTADSKKRAPHRVGVFPIKPAGAGLAGASDSIVLQLRDDHRRSVLRASSNGKRVPKLQALHPRGNLHGFIRRIAFERASSSLPFPGPAPRAA